MVSCDLSPWVEDSCLRNCSSVGDLAWGGERLRALWLRERRTFRGAEVVDGRRKRKRRMGGSVAVVEVVLGVCGESPSVDGLICTRAV